MRVFITGATGFIGTALTKELLAHGHSVLGLSRSDAGSAALKAAGADVHPGSLEDPETLKSGAQQADAVAHLAFNHDFTRYQQNCEDDRVAIEAIGSVLIGTNKPLLITSGTAMARSENGPSTEDMPAPPSSMVPRAASEEAALALAAKGVRASIVRLPQVHDTTKFGLVSPFIMTAQAKGYLAYVGEGNQRWPAAHVSDVARLYRLALEKAESGAVYNAVGEEGVTHRDICEALSPRLNIPVRVITEAEIPDYFGPFAMFANLDLPASSEKTQKRLRWHPNGPTMIEDLKQFVPA
ncbi:MAG TPA: SDR family oxidoreductase [Rhizomicrobium sp.]|jgi:nucleoside-diphosphate-sugar epimerase|nr:SDR family oxidoreductase [Rhizomicrobium sp.]